MELFFTENHPVPPGVNYPNYERIAESSHFTVYELKRLFGRFCTLTNSIGRVDKTSFLRQPEVVLCPLADLAYDFEQETTKYRVGRGESWPRGLDFEQFVRFFEAFSPLASVDRKEEYLFSILNVEATILQGAPPAPHPSGRPQPSPTHSMSRTSFLRLCERLYKDVGVTSSDARDVVGVSMWSELQKTVKAEREVRAAKELKKAQRLKKQGQGGASAAGAQQQLANSSVDGGGHHIGSDTDASAGGSAPEEEHVTRKEFAGFLSALDIHQLMSINI